MQTFLGSFHNSDRQIVRRCSCADHTAHNSWCVAETGVGLHTCQECCNATRWSATGGDCRSFSTPTPSTLYPAGCFREMFPHSLPQAREWRLRSLPYWWVRSNYSTTLMFGPAAIYGTPDGHRCNWLSGFLTFGSFK